MSDHGRNDPDGDRKPEGDSDKNVDDLDGGWGWFIVTGSFLVHMIVVGFSRANGVLYLQLLERFQKSSAMTSWALAINSTVTLCMGPLASAVCNKLSVRFAVFIGSGLTITGYIVSGFSRNLWFFYLSFSLMTGFGRAMAYCPCVIIVGKYFNKRRGLAVGLATCGSGVGNFVCPPLFELLFEMYGFQGTFLILAAIACHLVISGSLFRQQRFQQDLQRNHKTAYGTESPEQTVKGTDKTANSNGLPGQNIESLTKRSMSPLVKRKQSYGKISKQVQNADRELKKPLVDLSLFKNYAFVSMSIHACLFFISYSTTFVFLPALALSKGLTKLECAYLLSIIGISDTASRLVLSILLDLKRMKKFRLIIYNGLVFVFSIVSGLIPILYNFVQLSVACCVYGLLTGICVSQKSVVVVDILGVEELSNAFGLLLFFQGTGSLIGPTIGGLLKDHIGTYDMAFFCGSIGLFLGTIVLATGNILMYLQGRKTSTVTDTHESV